MDNLFYHGTVKAYLDAILSEGLHPVKENRWFAKWPGSEHNISQDIANGVYLTQEIKVARAFATNKVKYLAAKPGTDFMFTPDLYDQSRVYPMRKNIRTPVIKTSPIVLRVRVPETYLPELLLDPHDGDHPGAICKCVIEPKFISVEEQ